MAKQAFAYNIKTEGEIYRVTGPVGETICTGPAQQTPVMLGWIRLAAWAHAQLRDNEEALNRVLIGHETNNLDPSDMGRIHNNGKRRSILKLAHRRRSKHSRQDS